VKYLTPPPALFHDAATELLAFPLFPVSPRGGQLDVVTSFHELQ
jgi:hypothetical protein